MSKIEKNNVLRKKFIDWVNADDGLPPYEEIDEEEHDDDYYDNYERLEIAPEKSEKKIIDLDALDEELDYSDMFNSSTDDNDDVISKKASKEKRQEYPDSMMVATSQAPKIQVAYRIISVVLTISIIAVLLVTLSHMPQFGHPDNPANNEVFIYYVENTMKDTGAVNMVAAILLEYRAFDTLGEAFVLFTAAIGVIMVLRNPGVKPIVSKADAGKQPFMLRFAVMLVAPFVLIFGIYILLNGHLTPGGGFSGGAVLGVGLALYAIAYGVEKVRTIFNFKVLMICMCGALLFYAIFKGYSFMMGASGLDTGIPKGTPGNLFSGGLIVPLNVAVGIVVACTLYNLFALFSEGEV